MSCNTCLVGNAYDEGHRAWCRPVEALREYVDRIAAEFNGEGIAASLNAQEEISKALDSMLAAAIKRIEALEVRSKSVGVMIPILGKEPIHSAVIMGREHPRPPIEGVTMWEYVVTMGGKQKLVKFGSKLEAEAFYDGFMLAIKGIE